MKYDPANSNWTPVTNSQANRLTCNTYKPGSTYSYPTSDLPSPLTTIPGISTFEHLEENMSVMADLKLSKQEKEDLELGDKLGMHGLFCRQCGTCVAQCGEGIEIPTLMRS